MKLIPSKIRDNFSKSCTNYDKSTAIQRQSAKLLVEDSLQYSKPLGTSNILDLGIGTGNITKFLNQINSEVNIVGCDLSVPMMSCNPLTSHKICADICNLPIASKELFSHIYSSFCLQWISEMEMEKLFDDLYKISKPRGLFSFCLPIKGSFEEFFGANQTSNCNFRFTELPNFDFIRDLADSSGFELLKLETRHHRVKYPGALEFLRKIKASGANYSFLEAKNIINRKKIQKMSDILLKKYDNYITWNVVYCYLIKNN